MIVLDLEWSQPYGGGMEEILQIGAARLEELGGKLTGTFNVYIKPAMQKRLSPIARKLPDARLSLTEGVPFAEGYDAFLRWCGGETVFAGWGGQDDDVLAKNARHWHRPALKVGEYVDLQAAFNQTLGIGTGQRLALENAVAYCGIPETFEYHNALHDAVYAALVSGWIDPEAVKNTVPPRRHKRKPPVLTTLEYPKQNRQRIGPLSSREAVLDSRTARNVACPLCHERSAVACWFPLGGELYYGVFACGEHGRFPVRLAVTQRPDGLWQGRRVIPAVTDEEKAAFYRARNNDPHQCRRRKK